MFNKKYMPLFSKHTQGFSLVEMLVASVMVLILSATSYRVLTGQGSRQKATVFDQKKNAMINSALDRFKRDVRQADPLWFDYGIPWAFPQQGHGFGTNFYTNSAIQFEGLMDAVTLLTRVPGKGEIYTMSETLEYPVASPGSIALIGQWLSLAAEDGGANIEINDWVLIFKPGKYVLAVVTDVRGTAPKQIMLRMPNTSGEIQNTQNNMWGRSSGYVKKIGVVPGNFDWDGNNTASPDDNSIKLEASVTKVQVVKPVNYRIDYMTTTGLPHSHGNPYVLDSNGNKKKMIVRSEFIPPGVKHEYLAEATQLGITYDVLRSTTNAGKDSLQGYTDGDIIRDVGRETTTSVQFVNLAIEPSDSEGFISTSKIVSIRMFMSNDMKEEDNIVKQNYNEVRVALDPNRQNDQFQEDGKSLALSSGSLGDNNSIDFTDKQIGQPLYLKAKDGVTSEMYVPGSGSVDVVVPISALNAENGTFEQGKLVLFKDDGTLVDSDPEKSEIQFNPGADTFFYPSTMTESTPPGSANTTVYIGGFSVHVVNSKPPTITRIPTMATITYPATMKFRDYLTEEYHGKPNNNLSSFRGNLNGTTGAGCSLKNCTLRTIDATSDFVSGSSPSRLKDTAAGISVDSATGDVYVASITRTQGVDGTLSIYKTNADMNNFEEIVIDDSNGLSTNSVITAIAQEPIKIEDDKYQAVCTSRSINTANMATPPEDGRILLYKLNGSPAAPIEVATHNHKCKTLSVMNGSLVVAGNLVTQVIRDEEIIGRVNGTLTMPKILYTSEIANHIPAVDADSDGVYETSAVNIYADGYFTLPASYVSPVKAQMYQNVLGGNTGLTAMKLDAMTFGVVMGNRSLIATPSSPEPVVIDQQDFTTMTVNFGGMTERVIAAIDPNLENLNASGVVTKYGEGESKIPAILLPGNLYYDEGNPRDKPVSLPAMETTMNENMWFSFYQDYIDIKDRSDEDPDNWTAPYLPNPADVIFQCKNSQPASCEGG
jgi:prepilin-type N-terminal cleavage/methylation domain-containing protein